MDDTYLALPLGIIFMTFGLYFGNMALKEYHPRKYHKYITNVLEFY